jgi:hypothetical protein
MKARAPARDAVRPPVRFMILRSKPLKPTPRNGRWRPSVIRSGWLSMGTAKHNRPRKRGHRTRHRSIKPRPIACRRTTQRLSQGCPVTMATGKTSLPKTGHKPGDNFRSSRRPTYRSLPCCLTLCSSKSIKVLTLSEPKRHRAKAHRRFVGSHPCLVCGRQPSDAHHLRFAQPRALGMTVSDEFTVPLCREHHRQLHHAGNEIAWWHNLNIKPLPITKELWGESQMNAFAPKAN